MAFPNSPISEIQSPLVLLWPEWYEGEAQNTSGDRRSNVPLGSLVGEGCGN